MPKLWKASNMICVCFKSFWQCLENRAILFTVYVKLQVRQVQLLKFLLMEQFMILRLARSVWHADTESAHGYSLRAPSLPSFFRVVTL